MGVWMEFNDPKKLMERKIHQAFYLLDSDNSGRLDISEFRTMMQIVKFHVTRDELVRIFNHIDADKDGLVKLTDLEEFLMHPFPSRDLIRVTMDLSLSYPQLFLKHPTWQIKSRPFRFQLKAGAYGIGAHVRSGNNSRDMGDWVDEGSKLIYINTAKADQESYVDIVNVLDSMPLPFNLTFQSEDYLRRVKSLDRSGRFWNVNAPTWMDTLSEQEAKMIIRTYPQGSKQEMLKRIREAPLLPPHCVHCPPHTAWYITVHLLMDDEEFSVVSAWIAWGIMLLILLSTLTYILESIPGLENWYLWKVIEGSVGAVFTVELVLRLASCRNVMRYLKDIWNIVDLCAVAPFWIELATSGALETKEIRVIRALRLLRMVRLGKKNVIGDIMEIYAETLMNSFHMLMTLLGMALLTLILVASFAQLFEAGYPTMLGVCNALDPNQICGQGHLLKMFSNVTSRNDCEDICERLTFGGCCCFDQFTGSCQLRYSITSRSITNNSNESAALCMINEELIRENEMSKSPYRTVTESFWWGCLTMTGVGYGEVNPKTIPGKLLAVISVVIGLFFFALPVIVVAVHFVGALYRANWKKSTKRFDVFMRKMRKTTVMDLLQQVNEVVKMELFVAEDEIIFLEPDNRLNTKIKVEEILFLENGWGYLPYSTRPLGRYPRVAQFKLFVLFSIFGRNYQKKRKKFNNQKRMFNFHLDSCGFQTRHFLFHQQLASDSMSQWRSCRELSTNAEFEKPKITELTESVEYRVPIHDTEVCSSEESADLIGDGSQPPKSQSEPSIGFLNSDSEHAPLLMK